MSRLLNYEDVTKKFELSLNRGLGELCMGSMELTKYDLNELKKGSRVVLTGEEWIQFDYLSFKSINIDGREYGLCTYEVDELRPVSMAVISCEHVAERGVVLGLFVSGKAVYFSEVSAVAIRQGLEVSIPEGFEKYWETVNDEICLRSQFADWFMSMRDPKHYGKAITAEKGMLLGFGGERNKKKPAKLCEHYDLKGITGGYELSDVQLKKPMYFPILDLKARPSNYVKSLQFAKVNWVGTEDGFMTIYKDCLMGYQSLTLSVEMLSVLSAVITHAEKGTIEFKGNYSVTAYMLSNGLKLMFRNGSSIFLRYDKVAGENPLLPDYSIGDTSESLNEKLRRLTLKEIAKKAMRNKAVREEFAGYLKALLETYFNMEFEQ